MMKMINHLKTEKIMSRVKPKGLDYFPLNTNFVNDRLVRRVMKREGERAFGVLICVFSAIYSGEGYFVKADADFCDDLADLLPETEADKVASILRTAAEVGLFDRGLFERHDILTSATLQEQYLFIVKRRKSCEIIPEYCLLSDEKEEAEASESPVENVAETPQNVAETIENATKTAENAPSALAREKQNKTKQKKTSSLNSSSETGGTAEDDGKPSEDFLKGKKVKDLTLADINAMTPPDDHLPRNLDGLRLNLLQFRVPPSEQYAIILKSNFGVIGHPLWRGFEVLRTSHGKIRTPGRYLLSLCCRKV